MEREPNRWWAVLRGNVQKPTIFNSWDGAYNVTNHVPNNRQGICNL